MNIIAQYNPRFYPVAGGGETHVSNLVESMKDYNFEIITNALLGHPLEEQFLGNTLIRRFLPYDRSLIPFNNPQISRYSFPYRLMTDILRMHRKNKYLENSSYNLIHFHGIGFCNNLLLADSWINTLLLSKLINFDHINTPKILTIHNLFSLFTDNAIFEKYEHYIIDQFEDIICVDKNIENYVTNHINSKNQDKNVWLISNSVDTNKFKYSLPNYNEKLKVLFIGRLDPVRGINLICNLLKNLPEYVELHIIVSGSSNEIKKFKSFVNKKGNIKFYSNIPNETIPKYVENCDVVLNSVKVGGISIVSLEALSCGRPVIMLDKGDRYPTIHGKTGYLIKDDINELLSLLEYLNDNRDELKKLGKNARKIVEEEFSNEVVIPKIKRIYEDLMK